MVRINHFLSCITTYVTSKLVNSPRILRHEQIYHVRISSAQKSVVVARRSLLIIDSWSIKCVVTAALGAINH